VLKLARLTVRAFSPRFFSQRHAGVEAFFKRSKAPQVIMKLFVVSPESMSMSINHRQARSRSKDKCGPEQIDAGTHHTIELATQTIGTAFSFRPPNGSLADLPTTADHRGFNHLLTWPALF